MARRRHSIEQIIAKLRQAEVEPAPAVLSALDAFGRACLEELAGKCSALDLGAPVEGRRVSCLRVARSR